jgi:hypothetical protein
MPKRKSPQLPLEQYEPGQYPPGEFVRTEEYPDGVHVRANGRPDPRKGKLTGRQETFCKLIVEGILSNAECARRSGLCFGDGSKGPFATLFCSFSGFGIDRSGPKTMDRGPRPKVRGPWVDVGGPARRGAWTLCADRALRAVNLGPARGCPAPCAPFLLLIIEKRPEIRGPRASWPRAERKGARLGNQCSTIAMDLAATLPLQRRQAAH